MLQRVKEFVEQNIHLIESNNLEELFFEADYLYNDELIELVNILEDVGFDTEPARWKNFNRYFVNLIRSYRTTKHFSDEANSWSRLDYLLEEVPLMGFSIKEVKNYVLDHKDSLGVKCTPLPPEYGWFGSGDYDLGWLNKPEYRRLYW